MYEETKFMRKKKYNGNEEPGEEVNSFSIM